MRISNANINSQNERSTIMTVQRQIFLFEIISILFYLFVYLFSDWNTVQMIELSYPLLYKNYTIQIQITTMN